MSEAKQELVLSWLQKATTDLSAARLLSKSEETFLETALYHCQQAAEKALKGFLVYCDTRVKKTHNIGLLLEHAAEIEPAFRTWAEAATRLTRFATEYRYPGLALPPTEEVCREAIDDAHSILNQVLSFLPSEAHPN